MISKLLNSSGPYQPILMFGSFCHSCAIVSIRHFWVQSSVDIVRFTLSSNHVFFQLLYITMPNPWDKHSSTDRWSFGTSFRTPTTTQVVLVVPPQCYIYLLHPHHHLSKQNSLSNQPSDLHMLPHQNITNHMWNLCCCLKFARISHIVARTLHCNFSFALSSAKFLANPELFRSKLDQSYSSLITDPT